MNLQQPAPKETFGTATDGNQTKTDREIPGSENEIPDTSDRNCNESVAKPRSTLNSLHSAQVVTGWDLAVAADAALAAYLKTMANRLASNFVD